MPRWFVRVAFVALLASGFGSAALPADLPVAPYLHDRTLGTGETPYNGHAPTYRAPVYRPPGAPDFAAPSVAPPRREIPASPPPAMTERRNYAAPSETPPIAPLQSDSASVAAPGADQPAAPSPTTEAFAERSSWPPSFWTFVLLLLTAGALAASVARSGDEGTEACAAVGTGGPRPGSGGGTRGLERRHLPSVSRSLVEQSPRFRRKTAGRSEPDRCGIRSAGSSSG
jgi:hypothetical protein